MFKYNISSSAILLTSVNYLLFLLAGCTNAQNQATNLSAQDFANKLKEMPEATILDVRTPEEFSGGHLANALNYDWNGDSFEKQIAGLDHSKPIFVYCLSGGRSSSAARKMRSLGFQTVYEMMGGMMKWRAANLPETTNNQVKKPGMSLAEYTNLIHSDKTVLVDFYAEWCLPCKKMKPYLEEIAKELTPNVEVIRINADEHSALMKELKVEALPVLKVYKNGKETWNNVGFIPKEDVLKQLK